MYTRPHHTEASIRKFLNRILKYQRIRRGVLSILLFLLGSVLFISIIACSQEPMNLTITHRQELPNIPSASGIVKVDNSWYVVGDNSAWLYQLDEQYRLVDQHLLIEGITDSLLGKPTKPDFEAMTGVTIKGQQHLLIFGSGSVPKHREQLLNVSLDDLTSVQVYDLSGFYEMLRSATQMPIEAFNIEATAVVDNELYLFNRETNSIWRLSLLEFMTYLENGTPFTSLQHYSVLLPKLNGLQVKFSGASEVSGTRQLVFTASVEDAPNTYDDGEVLGSYVGIIEVDSLKNGYSPKCVLISSASTPIPFKVESVDVQRITSSNTLELVMVTDSDGSTSELIVGRLTK